MQPGQALPPRKLLRISHVFVSHTHMDHFAGSVCAGDVVLVKGSRGIALERAIAAMGA